MSKSNTQSIIMVNQKHGLAGPQLILPFFRPISIYEIEDSYDALIREIKGTSGLDFGDEMILFLEAFRSSLVQKNSDPLLEYFIFNFNANIEMDQYHVIIEALEEFIERATDENRPMH
ncbi:MAG: hypothetical protein GX038_00480 [Erysipelothrix sp.]|nr:hypothetical protein [Erysipelothrix sp.]